MGRCNGRPAGRALFEAAWLVLLGASCQGPTSDPEPPTPADTVGVAGQRAAGRGVGAGGTTGSAGGSLSGAGSNAGTAGTMGTNNGTRPDVGSRPQGGDASTTSPNVGMPDSGVALDGMCNPTAGPPIWVEEQSAVKATVTCGTGKVATFQVANLPTGAQWNAATSTLTWTPGLDQAAVYVLKITSTPYDEVGDLKIGVADKFDSPMNKPLSDPKTYTEEFGLPVFHLTVPDADFAADLKIMQAQQQDIWAGMTCTQGCPPGPKGTWNRPTPLVYRGKVFPMVEGHYRGASSLFYGKRNFTLNFPKGDRFREGIMAGGRMTDRAKIALITTWDDNSNLRWRLALELWNRLDPKNIPLQHFSAVVFVNGKYHGLYTVADKIDDKLLERNGLAQTGNVYMGIDHNANFERGTMACGYLGFTKKEGKPDMCTMAGMFVPASMDDFLPFRKFVAESTDEVFNAEVTKILEVRDFVGTWIHATAIDANDSYGKNGVFYHDPAGTGPWRAMVWDYNASFGQGWDAKRAPATETDPNSFAAPPKIREKDNNLWRRLLKHPTIGPEAKARYAAVLKGAWKIDDMMALVDSFSQETEAAAKRDERKWGAETAKSFKARPTDRAGEIAYARSWIQDRWAYLRTLYP